MEFSLEELKSIEGALVKQGILLERSHDIDSELPVIKSALAKVKTERRRQEKESVRSRERMFGEQPTFIIENGRPVLKGSK